MVLSSHSLLMLAAGGREKLLCVLSSQIVPLFSWLLLHLSFLSVGSAENVTVSVCHSRNEHKGIVCSEMFGRTTGSEDITSSTFLTGRMCLDLELWFCIHQMFLPLCSLLAQVEGEERLFGSHSSLIYCTSSCVSTSFLLVFLSLRSLSACPVVQHTSHSLSRSFYGYLIEGEWNMR